MKRREAESTEAEDALVAAMVAAHRRQSAVEEKARGGYASVVRHFERRGERLRAERLVTEELMSRLTQGSTSLPAPRVHREIVLEGAAGGVAAGRFRVKNRAERPERFELVFGAAVDGARSPTLSVSPEHGELGRGETRLVRVEASLAGFEPGESVTIPVELRFRTGFDRLWVVVRAEARR